MLNSSREGQIYILQSKCHARNCFFRLERIGSILESDWKSGGSSHESRSDGGLMKKKLPVLSRAKKRRACDKKVGARKVYLADADASI